MKAKAQCRFSIYIGPLLYTTEPWTVFDDTLVRPGHWAWGVLLLKSQPLLRGAGGLRSLCGSGLLRLGLLDGLVLLLLLRGGDGKDGVPRADLGAELAAHALVVVDDGHAVDHVDGVLLALLLAQAAADAGVSPEVRHPGAGQDRKYAHSG